MLQALFGIAPVLVFLFVRLAQPLRKSWHTGKDPFGSHWRFRGCVVRSSLRQISCLRQSLHRRRTTVSVLCAFTRTWCGVTNVGSSDHLRLCISAARGPLPGSRMHGLQAEEQTQRRGNRERGSGEFPAPR